MTEEQAFIAAIRSNPEDNLSRLVYADWLEEHGRDDDAELIRIPSPDRWQVNFRTKVGRRYSRRLERMLRPGGCSPVPLAWQMWAIEDPAVYPTASEREAWETAVGGCSFTSYKRPFIIGIRHGFVDAVGGSAAQLGKALPWLCRTQPITRVAVLLPFLEHESMCSPLPFRLVGSGRRVIRMRSNRVPRQVWEMLPGIEFQTIHGEPAKSFPDEATAHSVYGRTFLEWAREPAKPAILSAPDKGSQS